MNSDGPSKQLLINPLMKLEGVAKDASKPSTETGNPKVETQKEVPKAEEPKAAKEGGGSSSTNKEESPATTEGGKDRAVMRKGKWTLEEEEYTARIIHYFNLGLLTLPEGQTLRSYISRKLHCDPMRVTKKFTGACCIGKSRVFNTCNRRQITLSDMQAAQKDLEKLEARFWATLDQSEDGYRSTDILKRNSLIGDSAWQAYSQQLFANGGMPMNMGFLGTANPYFPAGVGPLTTFGTDYDPLKGAPPPPPSSFPYPKTPLPHGFPDMKQLGTQANSLSSQQARFPLTIPGSGAMGGHFAQFTPQYLAYPPGYFTAGGMVKPEMLPQLLGFTRHTPQSSTPLPCMIGGAPDSHQQINATSGNKPPAEGLSATASGTAGTKASGPSLGTSQAGQAGTSDSKAPQTNTKGNDKADATFSSRLKPDPDQAASSGGGQQDSKSTPTPASTEAVFRHHLNAGNSKLLDPSFGLPMYFDGSHMAFGAMGHHGLPTAPAAFGAEDIPNMFSHYWAASMASNLDADALGVNDPVFHLNDSRSNSLFLADWDTLLGMEAGSGAKRPKSSNAEAIPSHNDEVNMSHYFNQSINLLKSDLNSSFNNSFALDILGGGLGASEAAGPTGSGEPDQKKARIT